MQVGPLHLTYREWIEDEAARLGSDGTTMGLSLYVWCSKEHDVAYRRGTDRDGNVITKKQADNRFRSCIQRESKVLGFWNPIAWYRWLLVKWFGKPKVEVKRAMAKVSIEEEAARRRMQILREVLDA